MHLSERSGLLFVLVKCFNHKEFRFNISDFKGEILLIGAVSEI